jgi:hypothetical protein
VLIDARTALPLASVMALAVVGYALAFFLLVRRR